MKWKRLKKNKNSHNLRRTKRKAMLRSRLMTLRSTKMMLFKKKKNPLLKRPLRFYLKTTAKKITRKTNEK